MASLARLHRDEGLTIILIEHRLDSAVKLATRMLMMESGRIVADGKPYTLLEDQETSSHLGDFQRCPEQTDQRMKKAAITKEPLVRLRNVSAGYGRRDVLSEVNLDLYPGQFVALVGDNGAGKSTTLRTISGLIRSTSGSIRFMGEDITRKPAHDIVKMGLIHVPEGRKIFKGMTILENLELGSFTLADETERKRRLEHVFEIFPVLEQRKHRDSALLSGGEQQMLAIGRSMMTDPTLLLLDEPSMGLAPFLVQEIMKIIVRLNKEGVTILLVEQNAKVALKLADNGYVLETGQIVIEGDARTLREDESIVNAYLGE